MFTAQDILDIAIRLESNGEKTYRDAHVELFTGIAGQLATIVEKSRLYQELLELNELKSRES